MKFKNTIIMLLLFTGTSFVSFGQNTKATELIGNNAANGKVSTAIRSESVNVNGVRLHYLRGGTGDEAIVLIHGFAQTSRMWRPLINELDANGYTVIAPDLRGLGDSSKPAGGYDKKTAAVDVHALVKSLGFKKAQIVGHDIGLMVAYSYATQYPNEVEKLVLMEAMLPGIGAVWEQVLGNPALWHFHFVNSPIALDLVKGRERLFLEHFWSGFAADPKAISDGDRDFYAKAYGQENSMRAGFAYFQTFKQDAEDNRKSFSGKLTMPVLVITGEKSMGDVLAIQAREVATDVTAVKFPNTGHWLMEERPQETKAAILKFLEIRR